MARRFTLQPLHALAQDRVEAATQRLAMLKTHWQQQEAKLRQLEQFRGEYQCRLADAIRGGMDMTRMRDFQVFIGKIETAIRQQNAEVARAKQHWEDGQRAWLEERRKLKTYDVLKDRHVKAEQVREGRVEQRELDEHARKGYGGKPSHDEG